MKRFTQAFQRSPHLDGRTFWQRVQDGLTAQIVGDRTVILNASLTVAEPVMFDRRAMVRGTVIRCTAKSCGDEGFQALGRG